MDDPDATEEVGVHLADLTDPAGPEHRANRLEWLALAVVVAGLTVAAFVVLAF